MRDRRPGRDRYDATGSAELGEPRRQEFTYLLGLLSPSAASTSATTAEC
ncbi:hypothetical protein [Micromonospora echinospora]